MPRYASSKRRPWPYDIELAGRGFRLVQPDGGELVAKSSVPIEAVPTTYEYGSADPRREKTKPWSGLYFGFGQSIEPEGTPRRVHYNLNVDDSINALWMLGPKFDVETVTGAGAIRGFVQALYNGALTTFILADNGVYRRTGTNAYSATLTTGTTPALAGGSKPRQAVRFKDPAGNDRLYVATTGNNLFGLTGSGTSWTLAASGAGPWDNKARALTRIRDEFWVGWDNKIAKAEGDPLLRASYAGPITIGEASSSVTWMESVANQLIAIKEDGCYTINAIGEAKDLFPSLRFTRDANNGVNAASWIEDLWVPWRNGYYKIDPTLILTPQGTEQLIENRSEVTGEWVASAGHNTWFNYELMYNRVNGNTYLLKYGSWGDVSGGGGDNPDPADFIPVHKGALKRWVGKQGTCMAIIPQLWPTTLNDVLMVGFSDGTVEITPLPRSSPDPTQDPACQFTTDNGEVYFPQEHDGFQADPKVYLGYSVFGPRMDGNNYAQVEYRTSPDSSWQPHTVYNSDGVLQAASFTQTGQRANFEPGTQPVSRVIEERLILKKTAAATTNQTPVIDTLAVHHQVRPALAFEYQFTAMCRNNVSRHDGVAIRRRAEQLRQTIIDAVATPGPVLTRLQDGTEREITYIRYEDHLRNVRNRNGLEWDVAVTGIGLETLSPSVTLGTLSHGSLEAYTHGQLESLL